MDKLNFDTCMEEFNKAMEEASALTEQLNIRHEQENVVEMPLLILQSALMLGRMLEAYSSLLNSFELQCSKATKVLQRGGSVEEKRNREQSEPVPRANSHIVSHVARPSINANASSSSDDEAASNVDEEALCSDDELKLSDISYFQNTQSCLSSSNYLQWDGAASNFEDVGDWRAATVSLPISLLRGFGTACLPRLSRGRGDETIIANEEAALPSACRSSSVRKRRSTELKWGLSQKQQDTLLGIERNVYVRNDDTLALDDEVPDEPTEQSSTTQTALGSTCADTTLVSGVCSTAMTTRLDSEETETLNDDSQALECPDALSTFNSEYLNSQLEGEQTTQLGSPQSGLWSRASQWLELKEHFLRNKLCGKANAGQQPRLHIIMELFVVAFLRRVTDVVALLEIRQGVTCSDHRASLTFEHNVKKGFQTTLEQVNKRAWEDCEEASNSTRAFGTFKMSELFEMVQQIDKRVTPNSVFSCIIHSIDCIRDDHTVCSVDNGITDKCIHFVSKPYIKQAPN